MSCIKPVNKYLKCSLSDNCGTYILPQLSKEVLSPKSVDIIGCLRIFIGHIFLRFSTQTKIAQNSSNAMWGLWSLR